MATIKFHLSEKGPALCDATKRDCPVGGTHFASAAEAGVAFDEKLKEEFGDGTTSTSKRTTKKPTAKQANVKGDFEAERTRQLQELDTQIAEALEIVDNTKVLAEAATDSQAEDYKTIIRERVTEASRLTGKKNFIKDMNSEGVVRKNSLIYAIAKNNDYNEPEGLQNIEGYMGNTGFVGNKVIANKYQSTTQLASNIREDIKNFQNTGFIPNNLKYSTRKSSGGLAINISAKGMKDIDVYDYKVVNGRFEVLEKAEIVELRRKLDDISNQYNSDTSNAQYDYFNRGFYGYSKYDSESDVAWAEKEKSRLKLQAVHNKLTSRNYIDNKEKSKLETMRSILVTESREQETKYENWKKFQSAIAQDAKQYTDKDYTRKEILDFMKKYKVI